MNATKFYRTSKPCSQRLNVIKQSLIFCLTLILLPLASQAENKLPHPETYVPSAVDTPFKNVYDDPKDLFVTHPFKDILPPEIYDSITFDQEKMRKEWPELVGFTAPDQVGKIAPEIKPGKYTYTDLEKFPGLKELIPENFQLFIKPGALPFMCNIPEFEIIPTRQFYYNLPAIEASKRNLGKTKLDKDGYIVKGTWEGGVPFPKPSGKFKAQQVFYNFYLRSNAFNACFAIPVISLGYDRNMTLDKYNEVDVANNNWKGRTLFPPFGWFDKRAEKYNEWSTFGNIVHEPRSQRGTIYLRMTYDDPEKPDSAMVYVPSLRRIRKLGSTDTQDPTGDITYDDTNMMIQKITPNKYPYEFEIIAEREYLLPYTYGSSPIWLDSKNHYETKEVKLMRRPTYVLQMSQMDPNYVYSKRIFYIDKEMFDTGLAEYYDQRGELYRHQIYLAFAFMPEGGWLINYGGYVLHRDYIDLHQTPSIFITYPAPWPRERFNMKDIMRKAR